MKHSLMPARMLGVALAGYLVSSAAAAIPVSVFSENFESGPVPTAFTSSAAPIVGSANASLGTPNVNVGTQGYSSFGFGTKMLRNNSSQPLATILTLTGLASHTSIDLNFLLAIIDSWDGSGGTQNDRFNVRVDGTLIFSSLFANGTPATTSFTPESGVALAAPATLFTDTAGPGSNPAFKDTAYDMGLQTSVFDGIAHTASTLTIDFFATGDDDAAGVDNASWSGVGDESFAIDNVEVILNGVAPEPSTLALLFLGLAGIGFKKRKIR